jgi:hypothetical protein
MSDKKRMIMLRLPAVMIDSIDALAEDKGLTRTSMVIMLLTSPIFKALNEKRKEAQRNARESKTDGTRP